VQVGQVTAVAWPDQIGLAVELAEQAGRPTEWPGLGRLAPGPLRLVVVPDGRRLDSVRPGDALGDARVLSVEMVPYTHERTYDILPASDSGTYFAGGALLGSTLNVPGVF